MPRARDLHGARDPAVQHFLAEGCPGYRHDLPTADRLAWLDLAYPAHHDDDLDDLRPFLAYRAELKQLVREPWLLRVLAGRTSRRPIECATHRRQRQAALRAELAQLAREEGVQLEQARMAEAQGVSTHAVEATRESFAERRAWLEREATATGKPENADEPENGDTWPDDAAVSHMEGQ